ncbi:MAG: hypothetical protein II493_07705, partial [Spirochaetales bacterium]|nr:hypothetical protein [Spirochaetales bacterium]
MCSIIGFSSATIPSELVREHFLISSSRGPDQSRFENVGNNNYLGFNRLAIMDPQENGMQPFRLDGDSLVCNGEIYGFRPLKEKLREKYTFRSDSDCEILLPLWKEKGVDMFRELDAEFALVISDSRTGSLVAARDPIGIRPLFYGKLADGGIVFCSEARCLVGLCEEITPFPPGCYYKDGNIIRYADPSRVEQVVRDDMDTVCRNIRNRLIDGVRKR